MSVLTTVQYQTIKNYVIADPVLSLIPHTTDGFYEIARQLNQLASPDFYVWKTNLSLEELGATFDGSELAALPQASNIRLQTLAQYLSSGINPSNAAIRGFFTDIFTAAAGPNTRANLLAAATRKARLVEKILATGTGTLQSPATMTFEGELFYPDIDKARNS